MGKLHPGPLLCSGFVSAAVHDLEARVGARLVHRTTRKVAPTQDGAAFYERCLRLIADVEETEGLFRQTAIRPSDCVLRVGPLRDPALTPRRISPAALPASASSRFPPMT